MKLIEPRLGGPYRVAFTTRLGGVSEGAYRSLNLGLLTGDGQPFVLENRRRLCDAVGAEAQRATMALQQHGGRVVEAAPTGILGDGEQLERCDGLWSDVPGQAMALVTADCLPVAIVRDSGTPALCLLHVGWRGLLAGIVDQGVQALEGEASLRAVIGPGIGPCCYRVREEVARPYRAMFGEDVVEGDRLDLWKATERALVSAGCSQVERLDLCTFCNPDLFFSHRRDEGCTGRQGVIGYVE